MRMRKGLIYVLAIISLVACTIPETRIFSIYIPSGKEVSNPGGGESVAIMVSSRRYLSQPYIAYRNMPYELGISKYSKWEAPPDEIVGEAFTNSLMAAGSFRDVRRSGIVPRGFYSLRINLRRFERSEEGNDFFGVLALDISLFSPDGSELLRDTVSKKVKLDDKSFLGLAKGLSSALGDAVEDTTVRIEKLLKRA